MEKQPNSCICFACGIDNPIGLQLPSSSDEEGRCTAHFPGPAPLAEHRTDHPGATVRGNSIHTARCRCPASGISVSLALNASATLVRRAA